VIGHDTADRREPLLATTPQHPDPDRIAARGQHRQHVQFDSEKIGFQGREVLAAQEQYKNPDRDNELDQSNK
jgi:hypothetical protein